ncbi:hypothetical protein SAMN04244575_04877 [Sinorhizobium meliloti]|nr:hypothetical protein SAMN04244575_04877 [Sinorhizobium meliloti]
MNDLTNGDFGRYADLYRPLKNSSETFCTPALTVRVNDEWSGGATSEIAILT